ncbi:MAG: amino acid adenylation domain-containing protein [Chitinophagaceae bacterium]|nr:amino acid adenylation domain-containing protein [Chitinophagaceae bacterium]
MALITSILASLRDNPASGIFFIYSRDRQEFLSYKDLYHRSVCTLARLQALGIRQGDEVILLTENNLDFLVLFWACLFGGFIPVPLPASTQEDHLQKLTAVWRQLRHPYLLAEPSYYEKWESVRSDGSFDRSRVLDINGFTTPGDERGILIESSPDSLAYIQFSSGSTGEPKGVTLTHHNAVTNARAIVMRSLTTEKDHSLSWMPLSHDMGLVCFHLANTFAGANQYIMPTSLFIRNPRLWMDMTDKYRITQLYSPNFGYHYFMSAGTDHSNCHWDLSSVRIIYNGAEPISYTLCEKFLLNLSAFGLKREVIFPGYGLAEASVAVTLPLVGESMTKYSLSREHLNIGERIKEVHAEDAIDLVETGFPVDHCEVRICGPADEVYDEKHIGHIQIRGGNVTSGYYNNERANQSLFSDDGWLRTGDLGFLANGRLTITGRAKNLIIINGKNYYPHDIEQLISASLERFDLGKVVVTGVRTKEVESEALLVFVLFKEPVEKFINYAKTIRAVLVQKTGLIPLAVIPVPRIPKTTSGKVRHFALTEKYVSGGYKVICDRIDQALTDQLPLIWEKVLGREAIAADKSFFDAGMTSLQAMQFVNHVRQRTGVNLHVSDIFSHNSFEKIAARVRQSQQPAVTSLSVIEEQEHYPVSDIQKRFWLLSQLQEKGTAFNLAGALIMEGELDLPSFVKTFQLVMGDLEIFQTSFLEIEGDLRQKISPGMTERAGVLHYKDMRDQNMSADRFLSVAVDESSQPFDLSRGALIRCTLFHLDEIKYLFVFTIHHIIADGWSTDLLVRKIIDVYQGIKKGSSVMLPAPKLQFRDYVAARQRDLHTAAGQRNREYWMQTLSDPPAVLDLPFSRPRNTLQTFKGASISRSLPSPLQESLKRLAGENNTTLFTTLAAALRILLYRCTGQTDIVIGTDAAGRTHHDWEDLLGCCINTLPLRTPLTAEDDFLSVLGRESKNLLDSLEHQDYPFDKMIIDLGLRKEFSRTPLFDVLLLFRDWDLLSGFEKLDEGLRVSVVELPSVSSMVDLEFEFLYRKETLVLHLKYNTDLFDTIYIERMAGHLFRLLESITEKPHQRISSLDILPVSEKQELARFQSGISRVSSFNNILQVFERKVSDQPGATAVVCDYQSLSYEQLNTEANQLADYLVKSKAILPGDRIGLLKQRSADAIIGSLAILKAGATCVPIDPEYPTDRIRFMLDECGCRLVLSDPASWKGHDILPYPVVFTSDLADILPAYCNTNSAPDIDGEAPAYILYTSGSEGYPKGVILQHKSIAGYIRTFTEYFCLDPKDNVLQQASLSFDISLEEIFSTLCAGACLIISVEGGRDIEKLVEIIKKEKVTVISATPLVIDGINAAGYEGLESLRILINGGDSLNPGNIDRLFPHMDIYNTYGPTETTICVTYHKIRDISDMGVIGKPLPDHRIDILDRQMQPVPVGMEGEICISGMGLAKGYVNALMERDVFIESPFLPGAPMYRTGDYGRWLPDGNIKLSGRKDKQMKWRGYRIEGGEIEKRLFLYEGVTNALVRIAGKRPRLTAYLVCRDRIDTGDLQSFLAGSLPSYMIPASFVMMASFPITSNGKLDIRALPEPGEHEDWQSAENILPASTSERRMKELWLEVLKVDDLGLLDNFFEAGGNSLQATSIVNRIRNIWGVGVSLRDLLTHPSIREITEFLSHARQAAYEVIPSLAEQPAYRVSLQQRRLWVLHQLEENETAYNLAWSFCLKGEGADLHFTEALASLVKRHESLRSVFIRMEGEPYIKFRDFRREELPVISLDMRTAPESPSWEELIRQDATTGFDLEKGPLFRVKIIRTAHAEFRVGFTIHHIITDGWSMNLIWQELNERMAAYSKGDDIALPALTVTYKDYAAWQYEQVPSPVMKEHASYWYDHLQGATPSSGISVHSEIPSRVNIGKTLYFRCPEQLTLEVSSLARHYGVTEFTVYLAILKLLLFKYTGHTDIVIATPLAGRNHKDLERQIGYFLNILPLRTGLLPDMSFSELLQATKTTVLEAYEHKDYPMEELIRKLGAGDNIHHSSLFDIMFVLQNFDDHQRASLSGASCLRDIEEVDNGTSIGKLLFELNAFKGDTTLKIRYNTGLFGEQQITRMAAHFEQLVHRVSEEPECPLYRYDILSPAEREGLLKDPGRVWPEEGPAELFMHLFDRTVTDLPDRIALSTEGRSFTYRQLGRAADDLAAYLLQKKHGQPGMRIAILVHRSERLVISMLAAWKAGGTYIPLDPDYPAARIAFMLDDASPDVVISEGKSLELIPPGVSDIVDWERSTEWEGRGSDTWDKPVADAGDLAYIMYTSGSTGVPKGVMISHASVANYVRCFSRYFSLSSSDKVIQQSSPAFDVSVEEIFPILSAGGVLLIAPEGGKDIPKLLDLVEHKGATILSTTPPVIAELNKYPERLKDLRVLISGGDRLKAHHIDRLIGETKIFNTYGPTETTVCVTYQPVDNLGDEESIGVAVGHHTVYILDEYGNLLPTGIAGEICISGTGLAMGYLDRPEETHRKFIENTFNTGERIYRTGDIGYRSEGGSIVFLGRKDGQLKINGYRVERGEIEKALAGLSGIWQAAVVPVYGPGNVNTVNAYYTAEGVIDKHDLRTRLLKMLPYYMIPAKFIQVEDFPLTGSGKIDYDSFPVGLEEGKEVQPLSGIEDQLASIWSLLLEKPVGNKEDNFFLLGGNSIKAVQLIQRISQTWQRELSLKDIFSYPVLAELAHLLGSRAGGRQEKIDLLPEQPFYDVSHAQQRIWVLSQLEEEQSAYHIFLCFRLHGFPDRPVLEKALTALVCRHESLRTTFHMVEGRLQQRIHSCDHFTTILEWEDSRTGALVADLAMQEQKRPFDLEHGPLFRAKLLQIETHSYILFLTLHHIISDGWSLSVLINELAVLYNASMNGKSDLLPALPFQYKDYAHYLNARLSGDALSADRDHWLRVFRDEIPVLELPADLARPSVRSARGDSFHLTIDAALANELRQFAGRSGATVFMVMMAAYEILLYHYTGQEDMVIGTPVTGREDQGLEGQVGCYINTLPLRISFSGMDSFSMLLEKTRQVVIESFGHQRFPFDNLVEILRPERDLSRSSLFDVMLAMEDISLGDRMDPRIEGLQTERIFMPAASSKFDLTLYVFDTGKSLDLVLEFCTDLFTQEKVRGMLTHYRNILQEALNGPQRPVACLNILSQQERLQMLGGPADRFTWRKSVTSLIEEQALLHPDSRAVVYGERELNYRDLNRKADLVADHLAEVFGVGANDLVGLMMDRSESMLVALLGILRSGAGYVPLDPAYPAERNQYVVNDCALKIVLTEEKYRHRFDDTVICMFPDQLSEPGAGDTRVKDRKENNPGDIAYIIYTSGSTGRPKGIPVTHKNVAALVDWAATEFRDDDLGILYAPTSYCFDLSVFEMLFPLSIGKPVRILDSGLQIEECLAADRNVLINTVPGVVERLLKDKADLSNVVSINMAGEAIPDRLRDRMDTEKIRFRNLYGPSEDTTYSTCYQFDNNTGTVFIGRPVQYTRVYILNKERQLAPPFVKGEICIAGDGLTGGYLNKPELTAERFVDNPFVPGEKLYCTGDWGRWSPDGNLEFLGRKDDQLKIRGYRIEPREIEVVLDQLSGIEKSLVVPAAVPGNGLQLMAFFTGTGTHEKIVQHLERYLPAYMIPTRTVALESYPLTPNGKIDRKALLQYAEPVGAVAHLSPRNPVEMALAGIWEEVLEKDKVGVRDNFFTLGGHSILAARVLSRINKAFSVKLALKEIFIHPTIEKMAIVIGRSGKTAVTEITAVEEQEHYASTHMQRRVWMLDQMDPGNIAYNMTGVYRIEGPLSMDTLHKAYGLLAERHEILRTSFIAVNGEIRQRPHPADQPMPDYEDCRIAGDAENVALVKATRFTGKQFDLQKGPLIALKVVQFEEGRFFFAVVMHHIVSDGWSMAVIVREVIDYYRRLENGERVVVTPLSFQYKDYAAWRHDQETSPWFMQQSVFWKGQLAGDLRPMDLLADKPRPAVKTYHGGELYTILDVGSSLASLAARYNATVYMLLVASLNALLYRYTGLEDILIGTPASGRWQTDLEEQIGFYVNTLTIRTKLDGKASFAGLLQQVRSTVLSVLEHQDYPFDKLVDELNIKRDVSRSPLFDIMIIYQERMPHAALQVDKIKIEEIKLPSGISKFDLTVTFEDLPEGLGLRLEYNRDIFSQYRMEQLQQHFKTILSSVIHDPDSPLDKLDHLPDAERSRLLRFGKNRHRQAPEMTIVSVFEEQVRKTPYAKALYFDERALTYSEINTAANRIAGFLRHSRQVRPDDSIGVMMDRSDRLIVTILGILKSGASYIPVDPSYPASRQRYMIKHSRLKLLLTEKKYTGRAAEPWDVELCPVDDCREIQEQAGDNLQQCNTAADLAYVMYTSGTTGMPKAVMIEHRSVVELSDWLGGLIYDHHPRPMSVLLNASISFDSSVKQLFPALLHGATLVMVTDEVHRDPKALEAELEARKIDVWDCTPGYLAYILPEIRHKDRFPAYTLAGGERLGREVIRRYYELLGERSRLINVYGVTEATVDSTFCITSPGMPGVANIGKPLPGTEVYLLDKNREIVPVGVAGEICIGGGGLARGYLYDEALTRERFIDNPYGEGRLYCTGDLGKWLPDGSIDFLGRMDRQVKVSGHRVELAEVENALTGHRDIQSTVVVAHEDPSGDSRLAAYFVSNASMELGEIKSFLERRLPAYMMPSWFIPLPSMPLNEHGKTDIRQLPDPATAALRGSGNYVQAGDTLERELAGIWEELLDYRDVGIHDNFFEIGGNSMKVIQLHQRIRKDYPGNLEIYQIFSHPTIKELAHLLREGDRPETDNTKEISVIEL